MSKFEFSLDDEILLVEHIKKNKKLYNAYRPRFRDIILKDPSWQEMSIELNKPVGDTVQTLKSVFSSFSERKRKLDSGSTLSDKKKWFLAPHLCFLENKLNERKTSNFEPVNYANINPQNKDNKVINIVDNNVKDNILLNTSSQIRKYIETKKNDQLNKHFEKKANERQTFETIKSQNENILKIDEDDDIDHFFKSLSLSVKKLPPKGISEAKLKMLLTFIEIENKYSVYPSTSAE